ncbi:MAG: polar amino acid transport system substrate-binding protein [Pseudonocardiales bacterium]|jgi:hypothetical protein|nr:polar amino acid transport system substrate-binding protein [Pseudonocardiales bacterium]MDT7747425.1 polar amino acid transport system substrate-binding protein [Pseudonocardiales bacterium]
MTVSSHGVKGETKIVGQISGGGDITADIAAMTKKDNGLVKPLNDALNAVIKNGAYAQVLQRWNLSNEAVPQLAGQPARPAPHLTVVRAAGNSGGSRRVD